MQKVINFSGGKTSAYMTITNYQKGDLVIFCDTHREHPATYKFIEDFIKHENIPVSIISFKDGFKGLLEKLNHEKIPNVAMRFCTVELKIRTAKRFLKSLGVLSFTNLIGFRHDEQERILNHKERFTKVKTQFPLNVPGLNKEFINNYWKSKPYNLEIPPILGNCTLCFLKGKNAIVSILSQFPELAAPWIEDEEESAKHGGHTYIKGTTIKQLLHISQHNLFPKNSLDTINPAFSCSCTS